MAKNSDDVLETALRLLGVRQRSVFELGRKLREKGFSDDDIEGVTERLLRSGYLNDEEFAGALARSRSRNKAWGPGKISQDLAARGVARATIKEAVALACPDEDALAAEALGKWRRKSRAAASGEQWRAKAFRHLLSKGFSPAAIWKAIGKKGPEDEQA